MAVADYGMLTILKTSEQGGLQIHLDGTWIDVEPIPGEAKSEAPTVFRPTKVTLFKGTPLLDIHISCRNLHCQSGRHARTLVKLHVPQHSAQARASFRAKDFGTFALAAVRFAACRVVECSESLTLSRVLGRGQERYSIPFFMEPNFYTKVECLPHCCSADNPPMYPPTTSGQHILDRYQATHEAYSAGQAGHKEVKA